MVVVVVAKIVAFKGPPRKAHDWQRLAAAAGDPSAAALLYYVCNQTKWRRALGKAQSSHSGFAATGEEGTILGPWAWTLQRPLSTWSLQPSMRESIVGTSKQS